MITDGSMPHLLHCNAKDLFTSSATWSTCPDSAQWYYPACVGGFPTLARTCITNIPTPNSPHPFGLSYSAASASFQIIQCAIAWRQQHRAGGNRRLSLSVSPESHTWHTAIYTSNRTSALHPDQCSYQFSGRQYHQLAPCHALVGGTETTHPQDGFASWKERLKH